jgi:hypothetical protein
MGSFKGFDPYSYFLWIGLAAFVGWALSRIPSRKRRTYVPGGIQEADLHPGESKSSAKSKQRKEKGGLLSLVLELLGAVAISLVQRYFKSWRSTLIVRHRNPPEPELSFADLSRKVMPKNGNRLPDHRIETSPEKAESEKPYQKSVVALFKNTASEWIQDKCPQLGAALAYLTAIQ